MDFACISLRVIVCVRVGSLSAWLPLHSPFSLDAFRPASPLHTLPTCSNEMMFRTFGFHLWSTCTSVPNVVGGGRGGGAGVQWVWPFTVLRGIPGMHQQERLMRTEEVVCVCTCVCVWWPGSPVNRVLDLCGYLVNNRPRHCRPMAACYMYLPPFDTWVKCDV